jgi:hypothetical protein
MSTSDEERIAEMVIDTIDVWMTGYTDTTAYEDGRQRKIITDTIERPNAITIREVPLDGSFPDEDEAGVYDITVTVTKQEDT